MAQKKITTQFDEPAAYKIGTTILAMFDKYSLEQSSTILFGVTMALATLCNDMGQHATDEGSVERLVLRWLSATDPAGNHFSDYINLPKK